MFYYGTYNLGLSEFQLKRIDTISGNINLIGQAYFISATEYIYVGGAVTLNPFINYPSMRAFVMKSFDQS
jgi:hypothetical protein